MDSGSSTTINSKRKAWEYCLGIALMLVALIFPRYIVIAIAAAIVVVVVGKALDKDVSSTKNSLLGLAFLLVFCMAMLISPKLFLAGVLLSIVVALAGNAFAKKSPRLDTFLSGLSL